MDGGFLLIAAFTLLLITGSVLGWINFFTIRELRRQLNAMQQQAPQREPVAPDRPEAPYYSEQVSEPVASAQPQAEVQLEANAEVAQAIPQPPLAPAHPLVQPPEEAAWLAHLKSHWMVWLGGLCIGLAGIFLAAYSIEQGFLGPQARIISGLLVGFALHGAAEFLRRRASMRIEALAGLAGGASVTIYAALLAALHLYALWPPGLVFALLAMVSLGTLVLSLWHGPTLAIIGLVGAYAVPLLIGGDAEDLRMLLVYNAIIAGSGFWLLRHVYRTWLIWVILGGALLWWALVLASGSTDAWLSAYLTALAYGLLAIPGSNYLLRQLVEDEKLCSSPADFFRFQGTAQRHLTLALLALLVAHSLTLMWRPQWEVAPALWLPFIALMLFASRVNETFKLLPWAAVIGTSLAVLGAHLDGFGLLHWLPLRLESAALPAQLLIFLSLFTLLVSAFGLIQTRSSRYPALVLSLGILTPLIALALAWRLTDGWLNPWYWAGVCLLLGIIYISKARLRWRTQADTQVVWWYIAGHVAYSLAVVIGFSQATLTLALAAQVISLTWLQARFNLRLLDWLTRLVLMVIIARLTLNPWVLDYSTGTAWSFWTYGGSLLLVLIARMQARPAQQITTWLEGALLHLLVLFIATSVRYWLYDGDVFARRYGFTEAGLNTGLWAALGLVYYYRSQWAVYSAQLMQLASRFLLLAAVVNYALVVTWLNPLWHWRAELSSTPVFNGLLVAYGLPVLLFALAARYYEPQWRRGFGILSALGLWLLVSLEVRHLWHGELDIDKPWFSGELYSYSVSWLVLAVAAILLGSWRDRLGWYRGGMALLIVVIAKIFLIDMADLDGLLRVLSFMGLGLSLLGLGYLHQRFRRPGEVAESP